MFLYEFVFHNALSSFELLSVLGSRISITYIVGATFVYIIYSFLAMVLYSTILVCCQVKELFNLALHATLGYYTVFFHGE